VVEGSSAIDASYDNGIGKGIRIGEHVASRDPHGLHSLRREPPTAPIIVVLLVSRTVRGSIDFYRQPGRCAVKVEDIWTERMLAPNSDRSTFESSPQQYLRQRQIASESSRAFVG
jgi:hypothetical protein